MSINYPWGSDQEKEEFLADVSSFANTMGGDLIYGIEEENGIPKVLLVLNYLMSMRKLEDWII